MRAPSPARGRLIGYARVSTEDQATDPQVHELKAAGCMVIHREYASGASRARPVLAKLVDTIGRGDTLVVVRIDRLARSVSHLLQVIETLEARGAHFKSLRDPIDTSTPQGMLSLQILGAVAQFERALISERTRAGIENARRRGRLPGNPGLRARDPQAIRKIRSARDQAQLERLIETADSWLPTVRRMRPDRTWHEVVSTLNALGQSWTEATLRKAVRRMVRENLADAGLLKKAPRRPASDRLLTLVAGIAIADPGKSLREISAQLERMREKTPQGGTKWSASSVKSLLDRAARLGLAR
jgi:DNA invertase Pin-like site-specific DNA recombinase